MEEDCKACGVKIRGEKVIFSHGKEGNKDRLFARVCQYAKKEGCINSVKNTDNAVKIDFYDSYFD